MYWAHQNVIFSGASIMYWVHQYFKRFIQNLGIPEASLISARDSGEVFRETGNEFLCPKVFACNLCISCLIYSETGVAHSMHNGMAIQGVKYIEALVNELIHLVFVNYLPSAQLFEIFPLAFIPRISIVTFLGARICLKGIKPYSTNKLPSRREEMTKLIVKISIFSVVIGLRNLYFSPTDWCQVVIGQFVIRQFCYPQVQ